MSFIVSEKEKQRRIARSRQFIRGDFGEEGETQSDQDQKKPQPPLVKEAAGEVLPLPKNFEALPLKQDFVRILANRKTNRVYTGESISLPELSFLLWAQQGVRGIRGRNYATLRTVPSGGARHPFECYILVLNVEGLLPGLYHYLPLQHGIECLQEIDPGDDAFRARMERAVCKHTFLWKGAVTFFYSIVPYRGEWRYAEGSHKIMMIDAGHVTQNLYLACSALTLGTCAIGAVDIEAASDLFGLDGEEEYIFYCAPVGHISEAHAKEEAAFYAFLDE